MRRSLHVVALAALLAGAAPTVFVTATGAEVAAAQAGRYSVATTLVGKMLDDPVANALLKKLIPTVYANEMFHSAGRELTLQAIQQYEPEALSDENLARIQTELNKLPAKP